MVKKVKCMFAMLLALSMVVNVGSVAAKEYKGETKGGDDGSTDVTYSIDISGGASTYSQAVLEIKTKNRVEKLGIKNINVVTKDGGGVMGQEASAKDAFSASYKGGGYAPGSITSISAHYYVTSAKYGNFSKNLSY